MVKIKKIILSSLIAFGLLHANEVAEILESSLPKIEVDKPIKINLTNIMNKAKKELLEKNKKAQVYTAIASIDVGPDDAEYYDYLSVAYNEALLDLKANMLLSKAGTLSGEEAQKI